MYGEVDFIRSGAERAEGIVSYWESLVKLVGHGFIVG